MRWVRPPSSATPPFVGGRPTAAIADDGSRLAFAADSGASSGDVMEAIVQASKTIAIDAWKPWDAVQRSEDWVKLERAPFERLLMTEGEEAEMKRRHSAMAEQQAEGMK